MTMEIVQNHASAVSNNKSNRYMDLGIYVAGKWASEL
jgi:hypothetical protein